MTANRDFKNLVRRRMRKTGESYTAARRHFLENEEAMKFRQSLSERSELNQSIERLDLTLKSARILNQQNVRTIGQLAARSEHELVRMGLTGERLIEIREVLASRGI